MIKRMDDDAVLNRDQAKRINKYTVSKYLCKLKTSRAVQVETYYN